MATDDDFVFVVTRRKGLGKRRCKDIKGKHTKEDNQYEKCDISSPKKYVQTRKKILRYCEEVKISEFWKNAKEKLETVCLDVGEVKEIVCYGIGPIGNTYISQYQLALLLLLKEILKVKDAFVFDPILSVSEQNLLQELELQIIPEDEDCRRAVHQTTLFFMPHCTNPMYNNVLQANWNMDNLPRVLLLGNNLEDVGLRVYERILMEDAPLIPKILPIVKVSALKNSFDPTEAFNDLAIHAFYKNELDKLFL